MAVGLAGLAGCSSISIPFFGGRKSEATATPACPVAVILHPLANTAVFNKTGGDLKPLNVTWYGVFSDISASCTVSGDTLHASLDNIIVAERGPAVRGNDVDLNYFVALTAGDQTILGKKSFSVRVTVPAASKRGGVNDHVEVAFATGGHAMSDLNITVGFQQSPQAIEFYKNFRGR
ncbi:MAG TPA: hypothetical protein VFC56_03675 [Stellaceae bacterium]|nr:hypothetical protein [Stellaceae bacterium]